MTDPGAPAQNPADVQNLQDEVARLRAELADARSAPQPTQPIVVQQPPRHTFRWIITVLLAVLLVVLTPMAVAGSWARSVVFDTDRYVATVGPMVQDPAIQAALTEQISVQVIDELDVESLLEDAIDTLQLDGSGLPLEALVGPATSGLESLIRTAVGRVVASDAFAAAWEGANRIAHDQIVGALTGQSEFVEVSDTQVSIQAEAFVDVIRQGLEDAGLDSVAGLIPDTDATFVLFESDALPQVQQAMNLLDAVGTWLWVVLIVLAVATVFAAPRRGTGVMVSAGSVVIGTLLLAGLLALARSSLVGQADTETAVEAQAALFDQLVSLLRIANRALFVLGVIVFAAAWLAGRSAAATGARRGLGAAVNQMRGATVGDAEPGPTRQWVTRYRRPLEVGSVLLGALVLLLWPYPSAWVVVVLALLVVVAVAAIEVASGSAVPSAQDQVTEPADAGSQDTLTPPPIAGNPDELAAAPSGAQPGDDQSP